MRGLSFALFLLSFLWLSPSLSGQGSGAKILATKGTGRTTGHIATLTVSNRSDKDISINGQTYFIPSANRYQSYVGRTESTKIPAKTTINIPVDGYCTDVHKPPVPLGAKMPDLSSWIPVQEGGQFANPSGIYLSDREPLLPFGVSDISRLVNSSGFHPETEKTASNFTTTFPGTDIPLAGTIDPEEQPVDFAPLIVAVVTQVENVVPQIQEDPNYSTPFAANPAREREAMIQQTVWITMGALTGSAYDKEDFTENVHKQFAESTGRQVSSLPQEDQQKVNSGVDDFWDTFSAVGVEAKVFQVEDDPQMQIFPHLEKDKVKEKIEGAGDDKNQVPGEDQPRDPDPEPMAPAATTACICDNLDFQLLVRRVNAKKAGRSQQFLNETYSLDFEEDEDISVDVEDWEAGDYYVVAANNITVDCHCQNGNAGEVDCDFYAGAASVPNKDKVKVEEIEDQRKNTDVADLKDKEKGNNVIEKASKKGQSFRFKVTPKKSDNKEDAGKVSFQVCISANCASDDCALEKNKTECKKCLTISFDK